MTEQKPVAWLFRRWSTIDNRWADAMTAFEDPSGRSDVTSIRPLYEHPAPAQPATDPAVEAARRKALRHLLDKLEHHSQCSDWAPIVMAFGVLRDLLGQPRKCPEQRQIAGYDEEPDLKVSATMHETRVNTADLAKQAHDEIASTTAMPSWAFRSVDEVAECLAAGHCGSEYPGWRLLLEHEREPWREKARRLIERARQAV